MPPPPPPSCHVGLLDRGVKRTCRSRTQALGLGAKRKPPLLAARRAGKPSLACVLRCGPSALPANPNPGFGARDPDRGFVRRRCFLICSGGGWAGPAASPSLVPCPEPLGKASCTVGARARAHACGEAVAPFLSLSGAFSETRLQVAKRGTCALPHVVRLSHCHWPAPAPGCAPSP